MPTDRTRLGMIAAICLGESSLFMMPFLVGAMIDIYGVSEGAAGLAMSLQMAAMTVTSFVISSVFSRLSLRKVGVTAGVIAVAGNYLALWSPTWLLFLSTRLIVGIGEGLALTVANAAAARTPNPHKAFTLLTLSMSLMGIAFYCSIPALESWMGFRAPLAILVFLGILASPALFMLPDEKCEVKGSHVISEIGRASKPLMYIAAIVAFLLFYVSINGLWGYTERIGVSIHLSINNISKGYLIASIISPSGPSLAHWTGSKWGMRKSLVLGAIIQVGGCLLFGYAADFPMFVAGTVLMMIGYLFLLPFFKAMLAYLDPTGRLAGAAAGLQSGGTILGPGAAGLLLIAGGTYMDIILSAAFLMIFATLLAAVCTQSESPAP